MDPVAIAHRGVTVGLRLGRGAADRLAGLAGRAARGRGPRQPSAPATFTPSRKPAEDNPAPGGSAGTVPTPASVARNIATARPNPTPARNRPTKKSVPGAKLPPPRPSTS